MVKIALDSLTEVDAIIFMIDTTFPLPDKINVTSEVLGKTKKPVLLLVNKIDLSSREKLLPILNAYKDFFPFQAMIPLSAKTGDGVNILMEELLPLLPEGPRLYPSDIPTDATERFIASEIIREKIFLLAKQEVPYSTAVTIESFQEDESSGLITIHATIHVERKSQKGIIIGKQGAMLKKIGRAARLDIIELLGTKIMLKLWVKVRKDWTKDGRFLKELGFG
jgi:GTP-binding protein Era